ncbi:hypothetical protein ACFFYR_07295 [Paraburkholderia dipogonis]|uniref:hypothetical protein n=1 Tax=Paraburkholderia dipogonis TaxID=1211383 RepID=UPI0035E5DEAE
MSVHSCSGVTRGGFVQRHSAFDIALPSPARIGLFLGDHFAEVAQGVVVASPVDTR